MSVGDIANTGLKASMTNMETISNNISNSNTIGFKQSTVNFADIYSGTSSSINQVGMGVSVSAITQDFSAAGTQLTNRGLDLSLANDGFFIQSGSGQVSYTRNGQLNVDNNGYLVGLSGRLQGYPATNGVVSSSVTLSDLQIPSTYLPAQATSNAALAINLDASASIPASAFSATDPTSYNYRSDSTIFDSLGNPSTMSVFFVKSAANAWNTQVSIDNNSIGAGALNFSSDGSLSSSTGMSGLTWSPLSGATSPQTFTVDPTGSTQYVSPSSTLASTQNGYTVGTPGGFTIDSSGLINMQYSNGLTQIQGQVAVAKFSAPQGLMQSSNMSWVSTLASGAPIISQASSVNAITPGTLESSNVDLTEQLVMLMGAQHDFQANAQVSQAYNQMLQTIEKM